MDGTVIAIAQGPKFIGFIFMNCIAMKRQGWVTMIIACLVMFLCFPLVSYGIGQPRMLLNYMSESKTLNTQHFCFNQTLDHFSPYDHRQFPQRYYEFLDYFRIPDGPIFLVIGGEGTLTGIANDYIAVLAKKFGAALVSLEHRYYGKSTPFKSLETENLKYLSSKQALFDLADSLNTKINRTKIENPWFVFGGSYSGALSAWFRLKFPHLTCGSLASSAVVLAVYNYTEFDQQIGESAGPECKAILQETTQLIEHKLATNRRALKASFNAADLEIDGDFFYFLADAAAIAFQYGNPDKVCKPLVEAKKAGEDLVDAYAKYVKDYYLGTFGVNIQTYDQKYLKNTAVSEDSSTRLWWFQVCTEVAYFQVAPSNDSIRSSKVDTRQFLKHCRYHLDLCKNVFGDGIFPAVDATNLYYGGTKIAGSKIIFTNGSQDPWRHASKQNSSLDSDAKNCSSPDAVHKVRQQIADHMDLWLSQCQDKGRSFI
ncbi:hypothetical protein Lal_00012256 [Lupinus albus]|nr:hypothetical protein Lal_00012256 [Lupinus albus]